MQALPADLESLVRRVCDSTAHLLALQDRDPDAPTSGCFHPAHWRDKTAGFADMRRQEAVLPLAWMWRHDFPGNTHKGDALLLRSALLGLKYWCAQQHDDGTFDEWYSQEHGYATTAFSTFAVALTVQALGDELQDPLRRDVLRCMERAADWLATHDDWFKTNHEAVGVAALGMAAQVLQKPHLEHAAQRNAAQITARQHPEGWSAEVGACDVGYSFLLAEYLALHAVLCGEQSSLLPARKAFVFAVHFLHPDMSSGSEYGICANAYVSRVAAVALAPHDAQAAAMVRWMQRAPAQQPTSTLEDDLRLSRWAFQPLLAALLHTGAQPSRLRADPVAHEPLFFERQHGDFEARDAGLSVHARPGYVAWVAACSGAVVRVAFRTPEGFSRIVVDRGVAARMGTRRLRTLAYAKGRHAEHADDGLLLVAPLAQCAFVQPSPLQRLALAVAVRLPGGPRWARKLIDIWRARKGTALNQSVAAISAGNSAMHLTRRVHFAANHIQIEDRLASPADASTAMLVLDGPWSGLPHRARVDGRINFDACGAQQSVSGLQLVREIALHADGPGWRLPGSPSA
ncbi:MAG: hypothetical protein EXS14_02460 [Planctomycetes bacterium]|nr:hypothetical protein [Planctomycetota bacterium]